MLSIYSLARKWDYLVAVEKEQAYPFNSLLSLESPFDELFESRHYVPVRNAFIETHSSVRTLLSDIKNDIYLAQTEGHGLVVENFGNDVFDRMKPLAKNDIYLYQTGVLPKETLLLMTGVWNREKFNTYRIMENEDITAYRENFVKVADEQMRTEQFAPLVMFANVTGCRIPLLMYYPKQSFEKISAVMADKGFLYAPDGDTMARIDKLKALLLLNNKIRVQQKTATYELDNRIPSVENWALIKDLNELEYKILWTAASVAENRKDQMPKAFWETLICHTSNAVAQTVYDMVDSLDPETLTPQNYVRRYLMTADLLNYCVKLPLMNDRERKSSLAHIIQQTRLFIENSATDDKEWNAYLVKWYDDCSSAVYNKLSGQINVNAVSIAKHPLSRPQSDKINERTNNG